MRKSKFRIKKIIAALLAVTIMASLFVAAPAGAVTADAPVLPLQGGSTAVNLQAEAATAVTATPNGLTITAQPTTGGAPTASIYGGTPAASLAEVPTATVVTLTANPAANYTFQRWEGEPAGLVIFANANSPQTTFLMPNAEVTIRAVYQSGAVRNLVANVGPASGTGGAGGRAGVGATTAEAITSATAAAANTGSRLNNAPPVSHIHAIPAAGHTFSRWVNVSGGGTIANPALASTTFTMPTTGTGDVTIRAEFGPTRTVSVLRNNNAWGSAVADATSTAQHRRVNLTATPASGFTFTHWEVVGTPGGGFTNASIQNRTSATGAYFTMPNVNVSVRAVFQAGAQAVTITTNDITGASANARAPGVAQGTSIVVSANQTVTLTASPPSGHALSNWEVIGSPPSGFSNASLANRFDQTTTFTMPTGSVQIRANFIAGHRVSVVANNANLGTVTQGSGAATNGTNVSITASPTSGNRFVRWEAVSPTNITFANAENANTTFVMPNSTATVRAVFETGTQVIQASGGITVNYTIAGGNVNLQLPVARVNDLINATAVGSVVFLDMRNLPNVVSATLPRDALTRLANANRGLELRFPEGTININRDAATSVASTANTANIIVTLNTVARGALNTAQRDATTVNDRIFRVSIASAGQMITSFAGTINVTVPYVGTTPVSAWRLTEAGDLESITSTHNASARTVTFSPNRLSLFAVGPQRTDTPTTPPPTVPGQPSENPFNDVREGQWFFSDVMFVFANGLMGGTSANPPLFSPSVNLNRAMIVTILHRQEGTPTPTTSNPFTDVPSGQWFTEAIIWAAENNIVSGYAGRFNPLTSITRQDLAVILMRYADFRGITLPTVAGYQGFADSNRISGYAVEAVRRSFEAGIITGRTGNIFAPLDNSTRAEAAAMLHRFFTAG